MQTVVVPLSDIITLPRAQMTLCGTGGHLCPRHLERKYRSSTIAVEAALGDVMLVGMTASKRHLADAYNPLTSIALSLSESLSSVGITWIICPIAL
jgi:hypothetical protein